VCEECVPGLDSLRDWTHVLGLDVCLHLRPLRPTKGGATDQRESTSILVNTTGSCNLVTIVVCVSEPLGGSLGAVWHLPASWPVWHLPASWPASARPCADERLKSTAHNPQILSMCPNVPCDSASEATPSSLVPCRVLHQPPLN
jgi:hypothetical protein